MADRIFRSEKYIFPLFSAERGPDVLRVQRFLGTGFWLDNQGHFATCKHVIENLELGQVPVIGQPFGPKPDYFIPILESTSHEKFDVAVGKAPASAVGGVLKRYQGHVALGLDVQAFGFTDSGKQHGKYQIDPRLLRGYVSRAAEESFGLPSPTLIEVSFGSPNGFSGTPLLVNKEVVGILYSNIDSKLGAYSIGETTDGESHYKEVAYRVYEYGIAHRLSELASFFSQCGVIE